MSDRRKETFVENPQEGREEAGSIMTSDSIQARNTYRKTLAFST